MAGVQGIRVLVVRRPMCSISRDPGRDDHMTYAAFAPDLVLTVHIRHQPTLRNTFSAQAQLPRTENEQVKPPGSHERRNCS
jgi:hypothetical protein